MIMKFKIVLLVVTLFFVSNAYAKESISVDICIYGGTSAGVIAAYTAQKSGKSVILVEPTNKLGGISTGGLGFTDIGNKYVVKGLSRDFYRRLGTHYGKLEQWIFEPSVAEDIFNNYVKDASVKVLYNSRLRGVSKSGNTIRTIVVENSARPAKATNQTIKAKVFIDCSYEGDLMAKAGVSYTVGRESNNVYNETFNGVQLLHEHQFPDGIDPYVQKGNPKSGLVWGISPKPILPNGTGDKKVQAYNYRICLTDNAANRVEITKPDNYNPEKYELLVRLKEKQPWDSLSDIFIWQIMPNRKTDVNNRGGFSTDMIGMNWNYPEATYLERKKIVKQHEDYTKGLLYFLGHDERVPLHVRNEMLKWGYPKDEYIDNANWSPQLYVRETRRLIGETVMTQHHCQGKEKVSDPIAWAAYTMDSHNCDRHVVNGMVKNEGNVEVGGFPPYPISYKSLVPKIKEARNLLVPVCMSASHIAYGSIRMEPVFMVMSQSAAIAACLAIDEELAVQDVDATKILETLTTNPLADGSPAEILIDDTYRDRILIKGDWEINYDSYSGYVSGFLQDVSKGQIDKSVRYLPEIKTAGKYDIYAYFPKLDYGSSKTDVWVSDGNAVKNITVTQDDIKVEGQTRGEWVLLGRYQLAVGKSAYVEITNRGADNAVTADAVLFIPIKN
jgi:ribulose 1,5-bisphosphate synthetase/thiazole synthase